MANAIAQLFSKEKLVPSHLLNRMGAQPLRIVIAGMVDKFRSCEYDHSVKDYLVDLKENGISIIPDFLPTDTFNELQREARQVINTGKPDFLLDWVPNRVEKYDFGNGNKAQYKAIQSFFGNNKLISLFEGAVGKKIARKNMDTYLEWLRLGKGDLSRDDQTQMHSDTYYSTYKAWLYLEDVTLEQAPFAYVTGTQKINLDRLRYDYANSITPGAAGSRRIFPDEVQKRELTETVVKCKANTLAIANTFGYHRRLEGKSGYSRLALFISVRFHPFKI